MCSDERKDCGCIGEILKKILILQRKDFECDNFTGCDKPFLGPVLNSVCYNTRPIQLFNCCTGTPWSFTFNGDNEVTGTSDILRVESLDDCCCTCRILYNNPTTNQLESTGEFCTIDLKCCGAIRCLPDTSIDLC